MREEEYEVVNGWAKLVALRWVGFLPVHVLVAIISDKILNVALNFIYFFFYTNGFESRYGGNFEFSVIIFFIVGTLLIPATSSACAIVAGVYIAPSHKKNVALFLVSFSVIVSILLFIIVPDYLWISISYAIGSFIGYQYLKNMEWFEKKSPDSSGD